MYTKYKYGCAPPRPHPTSATPYCPLPVMPGSGAIPESQRIANKSCDASWITVPTPITYTTVPSELSTSQAVYMSTLGLQTSESVAITIVDTGAYQRIQGIGATAPVTAGTVPASATLRRLTQQAQINESDPYNPITRFTKYFPPAPLPYVCPERLPSNEPLPSTAECIPIQRFQGSAPGR